ncbi:MAG: hypothetical protein Q8P80_00725 [Candidatus Levybacteria bacterium]|nr:hypothetical protein [Candidatus Levybacteria bacterium]
MEKDSKQSVGENQENVKERIPHAEQIVVATNFLYKNYIALPQGEERNVGDTDGIRGDLALKLIEQAINSGVRIVAADSGSSSDFLSVLEKLKDKSLTIVESEIAGRAPQRRTAFEKARSLPNCKVILYTQPEKFSLIKHLKEISKPVLENGAHVVVLAREPNLFKESYPPYMYESEVKVNKTYDWLMRREKLIGKDESFDWFFGPVLFANDKNITDIFLKQYEIKGEIYSRIGAKSDPEKNSGNHYFPIIEALFKKKNVVSVEIPFEYPKIQKENEMFGESGEKSLERRTFDAAAYRLEAIEFLKLLRGEKSKIKELLAA